MLSEKRLLTICLSTVWICGAPLRAEMDMGTAAAKVMGLTLLYAEASVLYLAAG